jgi:hypothetical protein
MRITTLSIWAAGAAAAIILSGCSESDPSVASAKPDESPAAVSKPGVPKASQDFADCLKAEGVENVTIDPDGGVYLGLSAEAGKDGSTTIEETTSELYEKAKSTCQAKVTAYAPPADTGTSATPDQVKAAVAFAECARQNGFASWPDPGKLADLEVPAGTTKEQFTSLLKTCKDTLAPKPDANGGIAYTGPNFTGAIDDEWRGLVDEILLAGTGAGR